MKPSLRILIVDDERPARDKLRRLVTEHANVALISEARDGLEALNLLAQNQYDVIFLDIQMPEMDGLSVAQRLTEPSPMIVFVTAYDQFALQAFDANAIDYLLKPYDEERFLRALQKLNRSLSVSKEKASIQVEVAPLIIQERGHVLVISVPDIHWVEAADNYVLLHTTEVSHMLRQTMGVTAQRLGTAYSRCHRSFLVRRDQILRFEASGKGDGSLHLRNGAVVPCSRQYREEILQALLPC
nr:LytTR family DNA-binding domain-containing protein [uncultured Undibacterium sp.]